MEKATGTFEVTITPADQDPATGINRMSLSKTLAGDFTGTGTGSMLTSLGDPQTSATYVAVERLVGQLNGRPGSFVLAHKATMTAASQSQEITIAPDTGTDQLKGIAGSLQIIVEDGKHSYVLEYTLP